MSKEVCVIGFGRLGETLASILRQDYVVSVCETDKERAQLAREQGFRTIGLDEIGSVDTVIPCVPISQFEAMITEITKHIHRGTLVMDVCSVKVYPTQVMERVLPESVSIIATHPLFGPDSVSKGFDELTMVTYPVRVDDTTYGEWDRFWHSLGLNVIEASPEEHDRVTAYTLGMTHFFGRIMDELGLEPQGITTVGYKALREVMLQTCRDTEVLFHDMMHYNPYAKEMRERVYQAIQAVEVRLDEAIRL